MTDSELREWITAATVTEAERAYVHPNGVPLGCTYAEGDRCKTCGEAAAIDLSFCDDHAEGCAAYAIESRVRRARHHLAGEILSLAGEVLAWRGRSKSASPSNPEIPTELRAFIGPHDTARDRLLEEAAQEIERLRLAVSETPENKVTP